MDGRKGISDGLEVGVVVDVGLVPHVVPFTVQQGMEGLSDVGILVECFNRLVCKYVGSRLRLESIKF